MPEATTAVYLDTVTVSNFARAGLWSLITNRYRQRLRLTQEVYAEILEGIGMGYTGLNDVEHSVQKRQTLLAEPLDLAEHELYRDLLITLSPGEASCMACAALRGGTVMTDDRAARRQCAEHRIRVSGALGILKACVNDGTLSGDTADDYLSRMVAAGFYSPIPRISDLP